MKEEMYCIITEEEKKQVLRLEYARKEQEKRRRENELAERCKTCNHCTPYMCDSCINS